MRNVSLFESFIQDTRLIWTHSLLSLYQFWRKIQEVVRNLKFKRSDHEQWTEHEHQPSACWELIQSYSGWMLAEQATDYKLLPLTLSPQVWPLTQLNIFQSLRLKYFPIEILNISCWLSLSLLRSLLWLTPAGPGSVSPRATNPNFPSAHSLSPTYQPCPVQSPFLSLTILSFFPSSVKVSRSIIHKNLLV